MSDFLLELFSEEIPARMQAGARRDLERLFKAQLDEAGLKADAITTYSTPRRLALIATGLPEQTQAVSEEAKGPPEGAPDAAIDGFCRKQGISRDQLEVRDVKGRPTYFAQLLEAQRAWLRFRDGHCASVGYQARGGSLEPLLIATCKAELTRERTRQLKALEDFPN